MKYPSPIQNLIDYFSSLPTVGPKTAERYVFYLLQQNTEFLKRFAGALAELKDKIVICKECLAVTETSPCSICSDPQRKKDFVCIVANTRDLIAIEKTHEFNGVYHVLGGVLNPIENIGPEKLTIKQLEDKIKKNNVKEVILALDPNMEGETTCLYLMKIIKPYNIKITRLAKGLPMGADLEYADEMTLSNALKYRNEL
jgi:recombination protein RecR